MKTVKCLFCTKQIAVSRKGHLLSHLNGGGIRCVGVGAKASQMDSLNKLRDKNK